MNSPLGDEVATKADITAVKPDIRLLQWQIGIMYALQLAILVKLFVHRARSSRWLPAHSTGTRIAMAPKLSPRALA
ncbi:MAG: hypothetical protein ACREET_04225 [Stellaceae bacterium]